MSHLHTGSLNTWVSLHGFIMPLKQARSELAYDEENVATVGNISLWSIAAPIQRVIPSKKSNLFLV